MKNTSLSNNEIYNLYTLLTGYYDSEDWDKFFETIRNNNLTIDDSYGIITDKGEIILDDYLSQDAFYILINFYEYWLEHNDSSLSDNGFIDSSLSDNGFIDLRC